ncbi:MAG: nucleotidyltransferase family protein [Sphingomonas sp.]|nr:nucleotidyltransferase family protein [Sphingomonas sp.]
MIAANRTVLVLLAAGRSLRFGSADKLEASWRGKPLALHAVAALRPIPFIGRVAIVSDTALDFGALGYRVIVNHRPEDGLSSSLKLGVAAAQDLGAAAMLVALADMPRVSTMHFLHLLDAGERADSVIASSDGARTMPPALFAAGRFSELAASHGDQGGRELIRNGRHITAPPGELIDIDTTKELEQLRSLG